MKTTSKDGVVSVVEQTAVVIPDLTVKDLLSAIPYVARPYLRVFFLPLATASTVTSVRPSVHLPTCTLLLHELRVRRVPNIFIQRLGLCASGCHLQNDTLCRKLHLAGKHLASAPGLVHRCMGLALGPLQFRGWTGRDRSVGYRPRMWTPSLFRVQDH